MWVIDDDMIYRNDNLDFLNEPLENIVYAYGVQPIVRRPIFNNPFELSGKEVDKDFLLYSGVGVFFPPNVMRFSKELLEMAFRVSPTNDDAFFSAYMRSNSIRVKSIKVERGKNFRNLPPCTSERSLLDTNIFSFDTQVINCYKYFGINLNI